MGSLHAQEWINIGASHTVVNWILEGAPLHLHSAPSPCDFSNRVFGVKEKAFVTCEINELLRKDCIREVTKRDDAVCVLPLSVIPKKGNKFRLVLDCRHVNTFIHCPSFKNEGIDSVAQQIQDGDHLLTVDLESGFHHIRINPRHRKYLCFSWHGRIFQWCVLPFGVKSALYIFAKVVREVIKYLRQQSVRCSVWVDDFMLRPATSRQQFTQVQRVLDILGWKTNLKKCDVTFTTSTTFVGFTVFSTGQQGPWLHVPKAKIVALTRILRRVLANTSPKCSARMLARIAGKCVSMTRAVVPGKLLLRNVYRCIASRVSWESTLQLDPPVVRKLSWWRQSLPNWNGAPLLKPAVDLQIYAEFI